MKNEEMPVKIIMDKSGSVQFNEYEIDVSHMSLSDAYSLLAKLMSRGPSGRLVTK